MGCTAQQTNVENIANNLANANTTGYKTRRAQFQDLLYQSMVTPGTQAGQQTVVPAGLQLGLGTRAASNEIIFTQGDFSQTDNPLDVVIQGHGFFQIRQPTGILAYTRAGTFQLDQQRQRGDLQRRSHRAADHYSASGPGRHHRHRRNRQLSPNRVRPRRRSPGQIQLALFQNPAGLNSIGGNLYLPTDASGDPIVGNPGSQEGMGTLLQGYTEQSNVSVVEEFINLIVAQRAYEANSKVVKAADDMYQQVNNLRS